MKKQPGTDAHQAAVIAAFTETASVIRACEIAKVARRQHYTWLKEDPEYARQFEAAKAEMKLVAGDLIESEMMRRAIEGWDEPVVFQGQFTYPVVDGVRSDKPLCVHKYSDPILMQLARGIMPEKYRDRKLEVTGQVDIVARLNRGLERARKDREPRS